MDNYIKANKILEDVLKDPAINRDKLVIAKYLLESLNKTDTYNESKYVRHIVEKIDILLQIR